jgi:hypothetical protein
MSSEKNLFILIIVLLVFIFMYMKKRESFRIIAGLSSEDDAYGRNDYRN